MLFSSICIVDQSLDWIHAGLPIPGLFVREHRILTLWCQLQNPKGLESIQKQNPVKILKLYLLLPIPFLIMPVHFYF